jgi:hypothetical protein
MEDQAMADDLVLYTNPMSRGRRRPAFERYWSLLSARPAAQRAREIDDKLIAEQRKAR